MKRTIALLISEAVFSGCATISREEHFAASEAVPGKINWPAEYIPEEATFFLHNSIDIKAPPQVVWDILVDAKSWSQWYEGASNVNVPNESGRLSAGMEFTWKTMGQNLTTTVAEFEPPYRLGWDSRKNTLRAYHAWLIVPTETGCTVITEESQYGFLALMQKIFIPNKLHRLHDVWLAEMKARAELSVK